jgi:catechol 2,3-dioxygenase
MSTASIAPGPAPVLPAATRLGAIRLTVADAAAMTAFYERAIGLRVLRSEGAVTGLGTAEGGVLVELEHDPAAPARPPRSTGLFHLALLVPTRADLAAAVRRVAEAGWRFSGASDHLVSEALYLDDPEGNGIELYRDRPRAEWRHRAGEVEMATIALDLDGLMAQAPAEPHPAMPDGTVLGHVHLNVGDLAAAERFYAGTLGFEVMVRGYPGALFVAAGGYHHHLGLNTWRGEGAPPPPAGARGLRFFEIVVPGEADVRAIAARLEAAGAPVVVEDGVLRTADPFASGVRVRAGG